MRHRLILRAACIAWLVAITLPTASQEWPQWGGPDRNFQVPDVSLATSWPENGPRQLWRRPLGSGYSAILADGGRLYTLYRLRDEEEIVVALAAESGETAWEHRYEVDLEGYRLNYGKGPHSTPVLAGGRLFTIGTTSRMNALDAETGELLWTRDLWEPVQEFAIRRGYAASPIAYEDMVITTVGGVDHGVLALQQEDGEVVWRSQDFKGSQASPILIRVEDREQLVVFVTDTVAGLDPKTGKLLWHHPHQSTAVYNCSTPVWSEEDQQLFISSAYGSGSRGLALAYEDDQATAEELWHNTRMRIHFTNAVRIGDHVYGVTGQTGAKMLAAIDAGTGELAWRDRSIRRSNLLVTGDKVLALDEDGRLLLTELSPQGIIIHAESQLFEEQSWTVPTLVGNILYARNEESIVAVELPVVAAP